MSKKVDSFLALVCVVALLLGVVGMFHQTSTALPKQLIAPTAYLDIGPIDWIMGWAAGKAADYMYDHRNDPGAATSLGSAWWADGYATPTGGGGGGAW